MKEPNIQALYPAQTKEIDWSPVNGKEPVSDLADKFRASAKRDPQHGQAGTQDRETEMSCPLFIGPV